MNKHPRNLTVEIKCPKCECRTQKQTLQLAGKRETRTLLGTIIAAVSGTSLRRSETKKSRTGEPATERSLAKNRLPGVVRQHKERHAAGLEFTQSAVRKRQGGLNPNIYKAAKKNRTAIPVLRKRKVATSVSLYRKEV